MSEFWRWVPGASVGPFTFGDQAEPYIAAYGLRKRRLDCSKADWETYEFPGFESWIVVEKGRIIEVYCADEVEYNDRDLIGMESSEVRQLLGKEEQYEDSVGLGYAMYYYTLGITLFVEDEVVSAVACGPILEGGGIIAPPHTQ